MLVLALLGGTSAAFALTQALKLQRSPVTGPRFDKVFSPTCGCETSEARLALRLRVADTIDAVVVDANGREVRTLATDVERPRGTVAFTWDGRNDGGEVAADGRYRLRIHLERERRTIVIPNTVELDTTAPDAEVVRVRRRVFSPDGDGRNDRFGLRFRTNEIARGVLLVDGVRAVGGRLHRPGVSGLAWGGKVEGRLVPPGVYRVALQVVDRAGNASEPSRAIPVRLRYIELGGTRTRVAQGGRIRFRVRTDADAYRWLLVGPRGRAVLRGRGDGSSVVVRIPRRLQPGRYVLRVVAKGHRDQAVVTVLPDRR